MDHPRYSRSGKFCKNARERLSLVKMAKTLKNAMSKRPQRSDLTGRALIDALQASPHRDVEIEPKRWIMPVRDVKL
jgi:hypothetical protein